MLRIEVEDLSRDDLRQLISDHLVDMHATSPLESVHALDLTGLTEPAVTMWTARDGDLLLGCGALKALSPTAGEIKSMRTATAARGRGVGTALLDHLITEAGVRGYQALYLETGSQDFFAPARRLYARRGFQACGPFGDYQLDPNSVFMTLRLDDPHPRRS
ncbi:GNAT family N-acetyltransferase [Natronosporangium hydrolyticum]|nr:GNAT family N-acetyltransferase [Natronosporangium hydrolyticum]